MDDKTFYQQVFLALLAAGHPPASADYGATLAVERSKLVAMGLS